MKRILSRVGSIAVAMVLMITFAVIMGWATFLERRFGTPAAWWLVYGSPVFIALIALIGLNILAAMLARLPWNGKQVPFLLAHGGILVLLAGCLATFVNGQQGKMTLTEGRDSDTIIVNDGWEIELRMPELKGNRSEAGQIDSPVEGVVEHIPFSPGPFNWPNALMSSGRDCCIGESLEERKKTWVSLPGRIIASINNCAIRALVQLRSCGRSSDLYEGHGLSVAVLDYLTCADFDKVTPLEIEWQVTSTEASGKKEPPAVLVRFDPAENKSMETSRRGMRTVLEDGRRVSFLLTESNEEFQAFLNSMPETTDSPSVVLTIRGEVYQFTFDELQELQESQASPIALGRTGCEVCAYRLVPTLVGEADHLQGWTALLNVRDSNGTTEEMQLHSELFERNQQAGQLGLYGALWYAGGNEDNDIKVGRSQNPNLKLDHLELAQSPAGHLAWRYVRSGMPVLSGIWYLPEFEPEKKYPNFATFAQSTPSTAGQQPVWSAPEVKKESIANSAQSQPESITPFRVIQYSPHDELGWRLVPRPFNKEQANEFFGKVRLRVRDDQGTDEVFWLRTIPTGVMSDQQEEWFTKKLYTARGPISIALVNRKIPLGFRLHLSQFQAHTEPGSSTPSAFISQVDYLPKESNVSEQKNVVIQMNKPGHFFDPSSGRKWWVYQDSWRGPYYPGDAIFDEVAGGALLPGETAAREMIAQTVLSFNSDPGRLGKYPGSFLIILGTWLLIRRRHVKPVTPRTVAGCFLFALLVLTGTVYADAGDLEKQNVSKEIVTTGLEASVAQEERIVRSDCFDWSAWESLPVFSDGRIMPNQVFASILVRDICGSERPVFTLDPELLKRLEGPIPLALPSFEEFLADLPAAMTHGEKLTDERRTELKSWYDKVAGDQLKKQKDALNRLRALFPNGSRQFSPASLLFSWLVEPEVWEYVPFLYDKTGTVGKLINYDATAFGNRFAPATLDSSREFARRLDLLFEQKAQAWPAREEADVQGRTDRAIALLEQRYSQYRAITWLPEKNASPLVEYYLSKLLYGSGEEGKPAPLVALDSVVRELLQILPSEKKERKQSPFDDPEFILTQTTETSDGSTRPMKMLRLVREINLIAKACRSYPLRVQGRMLCRLCDETKACLTTLRIHRDEIFRADVYSRDYKLLLQKIIHLMDSVNVQAESAATAMCDSGFYRYARVDDAERIVKVTDSEVKKDTAITSEAALASEETAGRVTARPGARLSFPARHELCVLPTVRESQDGNADAINPWLSLTLILFGPDDLYGRFADPSFLTPEEAKKPFSMTDENDQTEATATAMELLARRAASVPETHPVHFFAQAAQAWQEGATPENFRSFNAGMANFAAALRATAIAGEPLRRTLALTEEGENGPTSESIANYEKTKYPAAGSLDAELFYDWLDAFFWMWFFCMLALVCMIPARLAMWCVRSRVPSPTFPFRLAVCGLLFLLTSCFVTLLGACVRAWITGWAPVTNMFETVVLLGLFISLISIAWVLWPVVMRPVSERLSLSDSLDQRFGILLAGTTASLLIGLLAYYNSSEFNPQIRPLVAVLRSNFWLTVHVLAIIVSYALGTIAWFISLVVLGRIILFGNDVRDKEREQTEGTRTLLMVLVRYIVLFLTAGIILGGLWADFSWGRFWSWDPKEVWALVTLMIYLVVLHVRRSGRNDLFSLAAGSALGALAIIMTWYGLSFVLGGGGRHAYTGGESTKTGILIILLTVNIVWVLLATFRRKK
ncbi:MAG: cytochrome c biogenesis protein CcsA [Planctomycetia bacterium]|nr:cytochrome c biogenesis protein CcsA [Planctomycetia bacterium]